MTVNWTCVSMVHTDEERHKLLGLFPSYILTLFRGIFAMNLFLVFFFFLNAKLGKDCRKILWILFLKNTLQISQTVTSNIRNETRTLNKYVRNKMLTNAMRKLCNKTQTYCLHRINSELEEYTKGCKQQLFILM